MNDNNTLQILTAELQPLAVFRFPLLFECDWLRPCASFVVLIPTFYPWMISMDFDLTVTVKKQ